MFRKRIAVFAATLTASLLGMAGIAAAAPAISAGVPESTLVLTISRSAQPLPTTERTVLHCQPSGGDHPRAALACRQLASVHGDIARLNLDPDQLCIMLYAPVTVTAIGTWQGDPVYYRETFSNSCFLHASKGAVFQF